MMIIFSSCTTIMYSLKLIFALLMVCLLHFCVFITNSAPTPCQLSDASVPFLTPPSYRKLSQSLWPVVWWRSAVACSCHPGTSFSTAPRVLWAPLPCQGSAHPTPVSLIYCFVMEEHFLQQLPKEVYPGGQYMETFHNRPLYPVSDVTGNHSLHYFACIVPLYPGSQRCFWES